MKLSFFVEPELEFGSRRHIDIRFGIMNYGRLDVESGLAPKRIHVGIAGLPEDIERVSEWLEHCREEIPRVASHQAKPRVWYSRFRLWQALDRPCLGRAPLGVAHAEEGINLFALAVRHRLTATDLRHVIYAYPTSTSDVAYML
ncbi:MAG: hypothetical protein ACR2M1_13505 [Gemmatimonadaceae bacterium]